MHLPPTHACSAPVGAPRGLAARFHLRRAAPLSRPARQAGERTLCKPDAFDGDEGTRAAERREALGRLPREMSPGQDQINVALQRGRTAKKRQSSAFGGVPL